MLAEEALQREMSGPALRDRPVVHRRALRQSKVTPDSCADVALILTDHREFDYETVVREAPLIVDTRNATRGLAPQDHKIVRL